MRTYILFKNEFQYEKYLDILSMELRKPITQFRISAHNLEIERGRYTRPITPLDQRICKKCKTDIGNEMHFLFNCASLTPQRELMLENTILNCRHFINLSEENKLIYLLNSEGLTLTDIAVFLHRNLP